MAQATNLTRGPAAIEKAGHLLVLLVALVLRREGKEREGKEKGGRKGKGREEKG